VLAIIDLALNVTWPAVNGPVGVVIQSIDDYNLL
jgi:hypothetical protein